MLAVGRARARQLTRDRARLSLDHSSPAPETAARSILVPGFGLVGLIVARRQPRNPIGWCCSAPPPFSHSTSVGVVLLGRSTTDTITGTCRWPQSPSSSSRPGRRRSSSSRCRSCSSRTASCRPGGGAAASALSPPCAIWLVGAYAIAADVDRLERRARSTRPANLHAGKPPRRELGLVGAFAERLLRPARARRPRVARRPDPRLPARRPACAGRS